MEFFTKVTEKWKVFSKNSHFSGTNKLRRTRKKLSWCQHTREKHSWDFWISQPSKKKNEIKKYIFFFLFLSKKVHYSSLMPVFFLTPIFLNTKVFLNFFEIVKKWWFANDCYNKNTILMVLFVIKLKPIFFLPQYHFVIVFFCL